MEGGHLFSLLCILCVSYCLESYRYSQRHLLGVSYSYVIILLTWSVTRYKDPTHNRNGLQQTAQHVWQQSPLRIYYRCRCLNPNNPSVMFNPSYRAQTIAQGVWSSSSPLPALRTNGGEPFLLSLVLTWLLAASNAFRPSSILTILPRPTSSISSTVNPSRKLHRSLEANCS